ncbi:uncharacterized protein CTRU02_215705 [Colletotrichum truncatum]|uniref:Uncharacterized protein n=1 Tax=Colletotrichum truncatum TaxID=5467 RepID=A0ACC3YBX8_COLTU
MSSLSYDSLQRLEKGEPADTLNFSPVTLEAVQHLAAGRPWEDMQHETQVRTNDLMTYFPSLFNSKPLTAAPSVVPSDISRLNSWPSTPARLPQEALLDRQARSWHYPRDEPSRMGDLLSSPPLAPRPAAPASVHTPIDLATSQFLSGLQLAATPPRPINASIRDDSRTHQHYNLPTPIPAVQPSARTNEQARLDELTQIHRLSLRRWRELLDKVFDEEETMASIEMEASRLQHTIASVGMVSPSNTKKTPHAGGSDFGIRGLCDPFIVDAGGGAKDDDDGQGSSSEMNCKTHQKKKKKKNKKQRSKHGKGKEKDVVGSASEEATTGN